MSVLIKDMDMPTSCEVCELVAWNDEYGLVCPKTGFMAPNIGRQDACPLVPVPPHGRLIDADELIKKAYGRAEKCGDMVNVLDKVISLYDIKTAHIIILAEEDVIPAEEGK